MTTVRFVKTESKRPAPAAYFWHAAVFRSVARRQKSGLWIGQAKPWIGAAAAVFQSVKTVYQGDKNRGTHPMKTQ